MHEFKVRIRAKYRVHGRVAHYREELSVIARNYTDARFQVRDQLYEIWLNTGTTPRVTVIRVKRPYFLDHEVN